MTKPFLWSTTRRAPVKMTVTTIAIIVYKNVASQDRRLCAMPTSDWHALAASQDPSSDLPSIMTGQPMVLPTLLGPYSIIMHTATSSSLSKQKMPLYPTTTSTIFEDCR